MHASVYLYRHFDSAGRLLYVGIANDPHKRLYGHARTPWIKLVAQSTYEKLKNRAEAEEAEVKAILDEKPLWNVCHNSRHASGAVRPLSLPRKPGDPIMVAQPTETCFASCGASVSFATGGPASQRYRSIPDNARNRMATYRAVLDWMECCDLHYGGGDTGGYVSSTDGEINVPWSCALVVIGDNWADEFLHPHALGIEPLSMAQAIQQRALW
jgi:predicted GIY-YIG superfamily endonuclease